MTINRINNFTCYSVWVRHTWSLTLGETERRRVLEGAYLDLGRMHKQDGYNSTTTTIPFVPHQTL
jgi:hypothetical protein